MNTYNNQVSNRKKRLQWRYFCWILFIIFLCLVILSSNKDVGLFLISLVLFISSCALLLYHYFNRLFYRIDVDDSNLLVSNLFGKRKWSTADIKGYRVLKNQFVEIEFRSTTEVLVIHPDMRDKESVLMHLKNYQRNLTPEFEIHLL